MTQTEQLRDDLRFLRHAVRKRESDRTPAAILILWGVYVLVGYTLLDFDPKIASWFFLIGGVAGGVVSMIIGRRHALRAGERDRAEGAKHALHWSSAFIAIAAIVALAFSRREQFSGRGEIIGQFIALTIGIIYFLAGVHFDRLFIWLGLMLVAGSVAISFIPRYGWTSLGILVAAGLILPALLRSETRVTEDVQ